MGQMGINIKHTTTRSVTMAFVFGGEELRDTLISVGCRARKISYKQVYVSEFILKILPFRKLV